MRRGGLVTVSSGWGDGLLVVDATWRDQVQWGRRPRRAALAKIPGVPRVVNGGRWDCVILEKERCKGIGGIRNGLLILGWLVGVEVGI